MLCSWFGFGLHRADGHACRVAVPPNIEPSEVDLAVLENSTASLECLATGVPAPGEPVPSLQLPWGCPRCVSPCCLHAPCISSPSFPADISWYKGNEQLVNTPGRILSRDGKRLEIPRAHLSDAGSYRCVASNAAGDTELGYSLRVTGESVGCRGRTGAVREQGAPPGPPIHAWGWWGHPSPLGTSLRDGFSRDPSVCPICHYPTSIPGNVPKGHGPTDGHCLVQILVSPTPAVPISAPWRCW